MDKETLKTTDAARHPLREFRGLAIVFLLFAVGFVLAGARSCRVEAYPPEPAPIQSR